MSNLFQRDKSHSGNSRRDLDALKSVQIVRQFKKGKSATHGNCENVSKYISSLTNSFSVAFLTCMWELICITRMFYELLSRDREDGRAPGNRPAVPRDWFRGVPERYVAGADTRGRQAGRPYPWSQQVIHEISGLKAYLTKSRLKEGT